MDDFTQNLLDKVRFYGQDLETNSLPALKSDYRNFTSIYDALLDLLKKRGLVGDDPYQNEEKISEIKPVSNEPYIESQRATVLSIRMHSFESQLDFINDFYQFNLEYMDLAKLKTLVQFTRYIRWDSLTETSSEMNTRGVGELVARLRKSDDPIANGLINDMTAQLGTYFAKIQNSLKKITAFKREEYKLMIRMEIWDAVQASAKEYSTNLEGLQKRIKKEFATKIKGQPYIPELIKEILDEEFATNSQHLKEEVLIHLTLTPVVKEKLKEKIDPRVILMDSLRTLSSLMVPLEGALKKLRDNVLIYLDQPLTLGERFRRWLQSMMGHKKKATVLDVEVFDPVASTTKRQEIDFERFADESTNRARVWGIFANRTSPQYLAMLQKTDEELIEYLERAFIDISRMNEKLIGLDLFFKTETPKERRNQIKGIKTEITQIKNILSNANKQKHEYVAEKEEVAQLARLGIKS